MDLTSVISQMAILLALIALGYTAAKCGAFPPNANHVLAQLVILVTNPATILSAALSGDKALSNAEVLLLTVIALGSFVLLVGIGQLLPRLLKVPKPELGVYIFMATFTNMGFMGFPVIRSLYGEGAIFYASIFNLVFQFVVYTYGAALLAPKDGKDRVSWRVLFSPIILASVLAYICYLTGFQAPKVVTDGLGMLGSVTSPVCMLVIGIALSQVKFGQVFRNWRFYILFAVRMILLPVGVYFLLRPFVQNTLMLGITVVMLGMPAATLTTIFCAKYEKKTGARRLRRVPVDAFEFRDDPAIDVGAVLIFLSFRAKREIRLSQFGYGFLASLEMTCFITDASPNTPACSRR